MNTTINANKIKGRIRELGFTQSGVAKELGISSTALNNKLSCKSEFTACEIAALSKILAITNKDAYFFVLKVE